MSALASLEPWTSVLPALSLRASFVRTLVSDWGQEGDSSGFEQYHCVWPGSLLDLIRLPSLGRGPRQPSETVFHPDGRTCHSRLCSGSFFGEIGWLTPLHSGTDGLPDLCLHRLWDLQVYLPFLPLPPGSSPAVFFSLQLTLWPCQAQSTRTRVQLAST